VPPQNHFNNGVGQQYPRATKPVEARFALPPHWAGEISRDLPTPRTGQQMKQNFLNALRHVPSPRCRASSRRDLVGLAVFFALNRRSRREHPD
jgi:hypothetical protein